MIVAGIDPSLTGTGIAIHTNGTLTARRKIGYPGHNGASDLDRARRVVALRHEVVNYVRGFHPDIVAIESPSYGSIFGSACDRNAFWHYLIHEFGVAGPERYAGVAPTCLKRFVTGNGAATKQLVIDTINTWHPHLRLGKKDDNIADAEGLATMIDAHLGHPLPFELRRVQKESLDVVNWPVGMETA